MRPADNSLLRQGIADTDRHLECLLGLLAGVRGDEARLLERAIETGRVTRQVIAEVLR